jgi:peptidoglycan hydrolase CwlO-like protein
MTAIRYNPLIYCEKLKLSGVDPDTANVMAMQQQEIVENIRSNETANKNDIQDILKAVNELKAEIKGTNLKIESLQLKIESLEYRIIIKLGSLMVVLIGILGFLLKH